MALDPRLLRSFVALAEELHFSRAAESLNLTQPALSQQIRRLESQVGSRLFARSSRMVELTASGRAMLRPARTAVRAAEQAEYAAREASRASAYPLRVGVNLYVEDVVPAIAAYASERSELQLWISSVHESQGHEMLAAGLLDAVVGIFAPGQRSNVAPIGAIEVPLLALLGPDHPSARGSSVPLDVYRESPIAIFARHHSPEQFDQIVDLLSAGQGRTSLSLHEFAPTGAGSNPGILEEVEAGRAVGFGSPATLEAHAAHLRILPFDPPMVLPTYISWQAGRSAVTDAFVEHMTSPSDPQGVRVAHPRQLLAELP